MPCKYLQCGSNIFLRYIIHIGMRFHRIYHLHAYSVTQKHISTCLHHETRTCDKRIDSFISSTSNSLYTTVISSSFFQWSDRITSLSQRQRMLVKRIQSRYITHTQTLVQRAPKLGFQLQTNNHNCKMLKVSKSVCFVIHTR